MNIKVEGPTVMECMEFKASNLTTMIYIGPGITISRALA